MTDAIAAVREFSRFYTNVLGLLRGGLLETPYSLTEARVLFELAGRTGVTALDLRRLLNLDPGYLSRILARFQADGLVTRARSTQDGRRQVIELTERGRAVFADLDSRSSAQIAGLLAGVAEAERHRLAAALETARSILSATPAASSYLLRPLEPGDLGWVVQRHGLRYAQEYGWDVTFEGLVARIVADYAASKHHDRERGWIAEIDGVPVGCVFCMRSPRSGGRDDGAPDDAVAQLRLLLVEPGARGLGIGSRLVDECIRFAASCGYREIMLWTNDALVAARRIYEKAGFRLVHQGPRPNFGKDLVEQVWRRALP